MNGKDHGHDRTAPSRKGAALTCVGTSVKQAARATPLMVAPYEGTAPRLPSRQTGDKAPIWLTTPERACWMRDPPPGADAPRPASRG